MNGTVQATAPAFEYFRFTMALNILCVCLLAMGLASASNECKMVGNTTIGNSVVEKMNSWEKIYNEGKLDQLKDFFTDDCIFAMHDKDDMVGNEAIATYAKGEFRDTEGSIFHIGCDEVIVIDNNWAIGRYHYEFGNTHIRGLIVANRKDNEPWLVFRIMNNRRPNHGN